MEETTPKTPNGAWIRPDSIDDVAHLIGYHVEARRRRHGRPGRPSKFLILRRQGCLLLARDILGQEIALFPGHDPPDPTLSREEYRFCFSTT